MKILYGVVGEGMGHAMRSQVVIKKLLELGHEVQILVSGRAYEFLNNKFKSANKIWGMTMITEGNEIKVLETGFNLIKDSIEGIPENINKYFDIADKFKADLVISDFETLSAFYAYIRKIPIISIDNMQIIRRCWHDDLIIRNRENEFQLAKSVIKAKIPDADYYFITTFFYPKVKRDNTTLISPILRDEILNAKVSDGEHILVYQTSETFKDLPDILKKFKNNLFKVYGLRRYIREEIIDENIIFCPFSEDKFISDLASSKAVIGSAGFTLTGEAVHLGKPYLATPVKGQFEQIINARYIDYLGYGMEDENIDEFTIRSFIKDLDIFKRNLMNYEKKDNSEFFEKLENKLKEFEK